MIEDKIYDIVVVGCGPAGLSAAINAVIRKQDVLVLGSEVCSPRLRKAPLVSNYLGVSPCSGQEMQEMFIQQAREMEVNIEPLRVESIISTDDSFILVAGEQMVNSRSVILTTGIPYQPSLVGEAEFLGNGLGYCATCDGPLYQNRVVAVIAHSPEAEAEANFLAGICSQVYYIPRYANPTRLDERITIITDRPLAITGQDTVRTLKLQGQELAVDGVFILGAEAAPDRLAPGLEMEENHIRVNRDLETNIPGLFAAGDCVGAPYQIAKAVGEGQVAGLNAAKYVSDLRSSRKI